MEREETTEKQSVQEPSYADKTNRIQAWSQLIKSIIPFIWLIVIIVVIFPLIGKFFITESVASIPQEQKIINERVAVINHTLPNTNEIEQAIATAILDARHQAYQFATVALDDWIDELMNRVDDSFLDWYFDYFNQKQIEFSTPFIWLSSAVSHRINTNNPPASQVVAEKLTEKFQTEFAKRVLRPKIAQLKLERITRDTVNLYVSELGKNIAQIQTSYQIPQGDWERYLDDIAITISDTEGNISNLSMKLLAGSSTYLLAKAMLPAVTKIGSKVAVSFAGKAGAKMAAKTGGAVAGKFGAQLLDPIVAVGIIIWDVWDYHHTVQVEKPVLREAIFDYLQEVKASLLDNHQQSIMAAIYQLENGVFKSLKTVKNVS
ncbi:hypothetical protein IQ238_20670 [Pleurocapsales cyanobacterium LEGE 06147]|nr:hypothetical protein [Pleurocapsales cyanobacterium LEGE 06147]